MTTFTAYPNRDGYYTSSTLTNDGGQFVAGNAGAPNHYVARFTNVTIPKNSTISNATLTLSISYGSGTTKLTIGLEAADNPAYPSSASDAGGRTLTSSTVAYDRAYSSGSYTTSSWSGSAQEVVDRSGWASGNAMQLFARDNASASWNFIQPYGVAAAGTTNDPYITINYTEPATGQPAGKRSFGVPHANGQSRFAVGRAA